LTGFKIRACRDISRKAKHFIAQNRKNSGLSKGKGEEIKKRKISKRNNPRIKIKQRQSEENPEHYLLWLGPLQIFLEEL